MLTAPELLVIFNNHFCELSDIIFKEQYVEAQERYQEIIEDLMLKQSNSNLDESIKLLIYQNMKIIGDGLIWITNLYENDNMVAETELDNNHYYIYPIINSILEKANFLDRFLCEEAQINNQLELIDQAILQIVQVLKEKR